MPLKTKHSLKAILEAIADTGGIRGEICARLDISRQTLWNYQKRYKQVMQALEDEEDKVLDMAESTLFKLIQGGDTSAVFYYLNNKGRKRGYGVRLEDEKKRLKPIALTMTLSCPPEDQPATGEEAGNVGN